MAVDGDSGNALVCGGEKICHAGKCVQAGSGCLLSQVYVIGDQVFGPYTWMYQLKEKHEFPPVYERDPFVKASFASYMRRPLAPTGRIYWV